MRSLDLHTLDLISINPVWSINPDKYLVQNGLNNNYSFYRRSLMTVYDYYLVNLPLHVLSPSFKNIPLYKQKTSSEKFIPTAICIIVHEKFNLVF